MSSFNLFATTGLLDRASELTGLDHEVLIVYAVVLGLLLLATVLGLLFRKLAKSPGMIATMDNVNARTKAWWIMIVVFAIAVATGGIGSILMFTCTSVLALMEFRRVIGKEQADNRTWLWLFLIAIPLNYYLLYLGWYGLFAVFIPVYGFLFIPIRSVLRDVTDRFLERVCVIQWGLMVCVYCISHAPALMVLEGDKIKGPCLLLFLVMVVELSDISQFLWGKTLGKHRVAPNVSPNKTYEGFIGGVLTAAFVGLALSSITPFGLVESFLLALTLAVIGFFGDLTMSAIKRSRDVKDYGELLAGHGGILDRIDSLCFAAPVFFHYVRQFYT